MKRRLLIVVLLILFGCTNSLEHEVTNNKDYSLSVKDSIELTIQLTDLLVFSSSDNDSLLAEAELLLSNYPDNKGRVSEKIAHTFYARSNLYLTKYFFEFSAKEYFNNNQQVLYAEQLTNVGVLNELTGNYPEAINKYYEALIIFNDSELDLKSASVYNNLGIVYQKLGDKKKSIDYYKKSLNICQSLSRMDLCISKYNNIASVFEEYDSNLDSALFYYEKAYKISLDISDEFIKPTLESNIANVYIQQGRLLEADSLLNHAFELSVNNTTAISSIYQFKAVLYLKQNRYPEAEENAIKAIELAKKQSFKEHELKGLNVLIEVYTKQNKYEKAFKTLELYNNLENKISGLKQKSEVDRLNIKYSVQEKDNRINVLTLNKDISDKRNKIFYSIIFLVVLFLLTLLYVFSLQKKHSRLKIKSMQRDISDYIKQLHDFEEELHEQEVSHHDLFLEKIKQFNLTEREEEVLLHISNGLKNNEIAEKMFVSINTVKTHIKNIFIKLDVRNRIEAANKAKVI